MPPPHSDFETSTELTMDQLNHKILIADNEATTTTMHNNNSTADGQRQNENETVSPTSLMIPPGDEVSDSRSSMDDVEATAAAAAVEKGSNDGDTTTCTASTTKEPSTKTQTLGTASGMCEGKEYICIPYHAYRSRPAASRTQGQKVSSTNTTFLSLLQHLQ